MRFKTVGLGLLAVVLAAGTASAAGGGTSGGQQGKGSSEGRGGGGPGGTSGGGAETGGTGSGGGPATNPDVVPGEEAPTKPWEVQGLWETHHVIRQAESAGASKEFNVFGLSGQYDLTENDRIKLRMYLFERFLADPGESGFRFDDIILSYTHRFVLPQQFTLRTTGWLTAPTSFASQLQGMITAPRVVLDLEKKFGPYVTASVRTYGDAYITRYRTAGVEGDPTSGGNPNPKYDLRFGADVEVAMPFHTPLSIGADVATGYIWYYEPNNTSDANPSAQQNGTVADTQFSQQPIQQTYAGEVFVRYVLPSVIGMRSDVLVAFANGDPSLGSVSVIHDGVGHFYMAYRQTAEVYGVLTLRY